MFARCKKERKLPCRLRMCLICNNGQVIGRSFSFQANQVREGNIRQTKNYGALKNKKCIRVYVLVFRVHDELIKNSCRALSLALCTSTLDLCAPLFVDSSKQHRWHVFRKQLLYTLILSFEKTIKKQTFCRRVSRNPQKHGIARAADSGHHRGGAYSTVCFSLVN